VLLGASVFLAVVAGVGVTLLADDEPGDSVRAGGGGLVHVRLLGVNDFHGHLEPTERAEGPGVGRDETLGGAAYLGTYLNRAEARVPEATIRVHAGDMVGASPLVSSHFHDEPTVEAMNLMDFDVGTVGNHEFDEGGPEMLRLIRGGHRDDGLQYREDENGDPVDTSDPRFAGVDFPYIAANTVEAGTGKLLLSPYRVVERRGVKVGFIGVTTTATPVFLLRRFSRDFRYLDLSNTVNCYVPELQRQGVEAIVVLAHSGAVEAGGSPARARGEIVDEARQMSSAIDVVVAGHTHSHLNLELPNRDGDGSKLVVEAWSYGTAYDEVDMTVDRASGDVVTKSADTPRTWDGDVTPEPRLRALVSEYARRVAPVGRRVVGSARSALDNTPHELGELVADGQRRYAGADLAVVNSGSIRHGLPEGPVNYSDLFDVHAYEHRLVRMELSGADVRDLLAQQWARGHIAALYTSGFRCECGLLQSSPRVGRVLLSNGRQLDPDRTYTVVANELIANSNGYSVLRRGRARKLLGTDLDALVAEVRRRHVVG
jgi:5'-nucleotidase